MNQKEIKELIEFLVEKDIAEFTLERGDMKLHIKRGSGAQPLPVVHVAPVVTGTANAILAPNGSAAAPPFTANPSTSEAEAAAAEPDLHIIKSPIVGTYYEAPSPGAPPFVKVGDMVKEGQVLCIIEAMKLMNEIEAEVSGEIVNMFVTNLSPVEYGMPLFGIRKQ
jgi:acetyl-CoA carboxylase biotin carboxyl carrier protein